MKRWTFVAACIVATAIITAWAVQPWFKVVDTDGIVTVAVAPPEDDSTLLAHSVVFDVGGLNMIQYRIETFADKDSLPGQGLRDSIRILFELQRYGVWTVYDSLESDSIPNLLTGTISPRLGPPPQGDTTLQEHGRITVYICDTICHGTGTMEFGISIYVFAAKR